MMRIMRLASLRRPRSNVVTSSARSRSTGSPMTRMSLRASRSRRLSSTWSRSLCLVCVMSLWYLSSRSQPLRVHVGDEPHAPRGEPVAVGSEPAAQGVESFPCFGSLNHDPAGVAAALSPQRAGAEDAFAVSQSCREPPGREPPGDADLVLRRPGELEADQGPGRGVTELAPPLHLLGVEPFFRPARRQGDRPRLGAQRLHDHAPRMLAAAAAPADLHEHRERPLFGAKVGVVNADLTLHFPDFRAEERTFAMLVQVGGRCGRGEHPGRVIVQTLSPEARPIALAASGEEERFYAEEMERRRELGYPPAGTLIGLELSGMSEDKVGIAGRFTAERLTARLTHGESVLGPGPLWRERGRHACRIVVKTSETGKTLDTLRGWLGANRDRFAARGVRLVPDVDPQWL